MDVPASPRGGARFSLDRHDSSALLFRIDLQPANLVAFGFSSVLRLVSGVGGFSAGVLIRDASRGFGARRLHALVITQSSIINQSSKHYTNKQTSSNTFIHSASRQ
jgi:hypothetical protein